MRYQIGIWKLFDWCYQYVQVQGESLVKKNPFIISTEIKNTLEEVGRSYSKSTIKRCLHECKYRGFKTRCKALVTFKNREAKLLFARKRLKKPPMFWNKILWTDETKINFYQTDGKRKVWRKKGMLMLCSQSKAHHIKCQTWWSGVMTWAYMAANGMGSLEFIDVTADRSSQMNSEVFKPTCILSAHVQPNATKLIGRSFTVQMDNELEYSSMAKSVTWSQSNRAWFSVTEDKTEGLKDPQTSSNSRWLQWRPGKASPGRKLRIWWCPWAPDYRQSLTAKDFHPSIKTVLIFTITSHCPNTTEPLKMEVVGPKWL